MIDVIGVELGTDVVRVVALGGWGRTPRKTCEAAWDPARPHEVVPFLREQIGPVGRIALSVGLGFLYPKQVKLPPAPASERRRMLMLEPDRFFPVQGQPLVISLASAGSLAFAIEAELLEGWIRAFEDWAPVESAEATPVSIARLLGNSGRDGLFAVAAGADESGLIEVGSGRLESARRAPAGAAAPDPQELPTLGDTPGPFLAAHGAALGVGEALDSMLLPDPIAGRIRRRRARRLRIVAAACAVSLGVALWGVDRARERALARIEDQITVMAPRAQRAIELRDRLAAMDREARAIAEIGRGRADPLLVLAALSERLPGGAVVLNARGTGNDWQIDGTAADAAAIVPQLDRDQRFQDVRFLSASARFSDAGRTYETFSIAFRVQPTD